MWENLIIDGYRFDTPENYKEAKKEAEAIQYIRAKSDLNKPEVVYQVYSRLLDKQTMHTVIGLQFLKELRLRLLKSGKYAETELAPIAARPFYGYANGKKSGEAAAEQTAGKPAKAVMHYKNRLRNARIVIIGLAAIIIAMFFITLTSKNSPFTDEEIRLQDKYSAWEEELTEREKKLEEAGKPNAGELPEEADK